MKKEILIFGFGGLVIGAIGGWFTSKIFYQKRNEEEIQYVRDYYEEKLKKSYTEFEEMDELYENLTDSVEEEEDQQAKKLEEAREKLEYGRKQATNYAGYFVKKGPEKKDISNTISDVPDQLDEEDSEEDAQTEEEARIHEYEDLSEDHKKDIGKPPRIISYERACDLPDTVEWDVLLYYEEDDIVTDEDDHIIDEPGHLIGTCLYKYNFAESDEDTIYVYNPSLSIVYEVTKAGAWPEDKPYV